MVPLQMDEGIKDELKGKEQQTRGSSCVSEEDKNKLAYCVTDAPPWYLCIVLAIQVCEFPGCCWCFRKTSESVHYCLKEEEMYRHELFYMK